ncbi:glycosyltransferase family 4 protein [Candidatus Wolfebacteria bacterium]|nr:glycosyltransferase family 4 protein [Candidatus Wolfebacteria bacterium]
MNKKIFLLFHGRFPSEKAASLFAAKSCESFSNLGAKVVLIVPKRFKAKKEPFVKYYNVKDNFEVKYVPTIDLFSFLGNLSFYVSLFFYSLSSVLFLLRNAKREDIIYTNETLPLLFASLFFKNTLFEVHDYPEKKKWFYGMLFSNVRWVLVTNKWKLKKIKKDFPQVAGKTFLERNAVEISEFDIPESKKEAREKLKYTFSNKKKIILYTGHLYDWKGVDILAEAAKQLSNTFEILFVGGTSDGVDSFRLKYGHVQNIVILGFKPHAEIPLWQRSSDLLILPNTAKQDISKFYTSPMKLFEYMASKTPILASNIPSISEILNTSNSYLVEPDNPKKLASIIKSVFKDEDRFERSKAARADIEDYSWKKRADRIFKHLFAN